MASVLSKLDMQSLLERKERAEQICNLRNVEKFEILVAQNGRSD